MQQVKEKEKGTFDLDLTEAGRLQHAGGMKTRFLFRKVVFLFLLFVSMLAHDSQASVLDEALLASGRKPSEGLQQSANQGQMSTDLLSPEVGALVSVSLQSQVGLLLDEMPVSLRDRVVTETLAKPESYWKSRAIRQIEATLYRLIYRKFFLPGKGRLPLPPKELWEVQIGKPALVKLKGHQAVAVNYRFESTLLSSAKSMASAEPSLANVGGEWREAFLLPLDPDLLLERTGMACMDEADFPPNSVDSENARSFYDHTCLAGKNICHLSQPFPRESCAQALERSVGAVAVALHFQRIPWSEDRAARVRLGKVNFKGSDLTVIASGLENNRLIYRYIPPGSCAIQEGCVGAAGWRRLLQFDASVANRSKFPIELGEVSTNSELVRQNMFEFSACHGHFHFSHYGTFSLGQGSQRLSSKRAFCLESTSRTSNNEWTPVDHPYTCHNQGIEAGWGDDYIAGIECQWIDVTDVKPPTTLPLGFQSNPDQFICEGKPLLDPAGNFQFTPTPFQTESGATQNRIACDFVPNWSTDNFASRKVAIPGRGSYVTTACRSGQDSPLRNCGFQELGNLRSCRPGEVVRMKCQRNGSSEPAVIRVCEGSAKLQTGTACTYLQSLKNVVMESGGLEMSFVCPSARDSEEPGGLFALYLNSVHEGDRIGSVDCKVLQ